MSLRKLTAEELQMVEDMGAVLFAPKETALAMGLNVVDFVNELNNETSQVYKAYHKGRLISLYKVRKNVFDMAANGSGPAQQLVDKYAKDYAWKEAVDKT